MLRFLFLFPSLAFFSWVFALPVINPGEYALTNRSSALPLVGDFPNLSCKLGFLGDYVLNRKLEVRGYNNSDIQFTTLRTHQGVISFTYHSWLDFYVGLGASQIAISTPASSFSYAFSAPLTVVTVPLAFPAIDYSANNWPTFDPNSPLSFASNSSFSYTVGLSSILWNSKKFALSTSGKYFYSRPKIPNVFLPFSLQNNLIFNVAQGSYTPTVAPTVAYLQNIACTYQEWQVDICLAYALRIAKTLKAIPFLSLDCAGVFVDFGQAQVSSTAPTPPLIPGFGLSTLFTPSPFTANLYGLQQQTMIGCTIGTSFIGNNCFSAGIEWRFANENAFSVDFNLNF